MKRIVIASFAAAVLAPAGLAGQPSIARQYGEWTMMGQEDPMDGWQYFVTSDAYAVKPLANPYRSASLHISWSCGPELQTVLLTVNDAPPIGRLRRWDPPASWYLLQRRIRRYESYEEQQETRRFLESRILVRVRWDEEPPTELRGGLIPVGRKPISLFSDPLGIDGVHDYAALSAFLADLSRHSTLLVEIPWADRRLRDSHFRLSLDGAGEAIEDTMRRCLDAHGR